MSFLWFPFISSIIYVIATLQLKQATALGSSVLLTTAATNVVTGLMFLAAIPLGGTMQPVTLLWQPAVVGALFVVGQLFTILALRVGDVSVATPVLGLKTILVASFATLILRESPTWQVWAAAFLSAMAILLLNRGERTAKNRLLLTTFYAGCAALSYALFDVLVQAWARSWGAGYFLPLVTLIGAAMSLVIYAIAQSRPAWATPVHLSRIGWWWLLGGAATMAFQALLLTATLATVFGKATSINVIYSGRGLWTVVLVWLIGHWFENQEGQLARPILQQRLAGAAVMTTAILFALTG